MKANEKELRKSMPSLKNSFLFFWVSTKIDCVKTLLSQLLSVWLLSLVSSTFDCRLLFIEAACRKPPGKSRGALVERLVDGSPLRARLLNDLIDIKWKKIIQIKSNGNTGLYCLYTFVSHPSTSYFAMLSIYFIFFIQLCSQVSRFMSDFCLIIRLSMSVFSRVTRNSSRRRFSRFKLERIADDNVYVLSRSFRTF